MIAGRRLGAYQVQALLGAGGMGEVYRARDTKLQRDVAVKFLPPAFTSDADRLSRFEREAQMLAALNHPNIGAIYGFEEARRRCDGDQSARGIACSLDVERGRTGTRRGTRCVVSDRLATVPGRGAAVFRGAHDRRSGYGARNIAGNGGARMGRGEGLALSATVTISVTAV